MKVAHTLAAWLLGLSAAQAQTLIPLDSRPATFTLPAAIASLLGPEARSVPAELLGTAKRGADNARLWQWLDEQPAQGPLVVALDTLAYGGLVQSRTSPLSAEEALTRLTPLRERARQQPIYAFITLPRSPDATNRARNLAVARQMMRWAAEGIFQELHITWDDALPTSPAPQEGAQLAAEAPANVRVYPGVDEVLSSLVARALAPQPAALRVEYSQPETAQQVIKYEGIALTQSVRLHAQAAGYELREGGAQRAPLTLYVYNGGDSRKAALRISALLREAQRYGGQVAVADVAAVNTGNRKLWADLMTLRRVPNLAALSAWGTPGNNIGTALAHAKLVLSGADPLKQDALLAREYANDVLYSGQLRAQLRQAVPEAQLSQQGGAARADAALRQLSAPLFPFRVGEVYGLGSATLPWQRSFEWQFSLQPEN